MHVHMIFFCFLYAQYIPISFNLSPSLVEASSSPSRNSRAAHLAAARRPSGAIGHPEARKGTSDREKLQIFAGNHEIFPLIFSNLGKIGRS